METVTLEANKRNDISKAARNKLRREGRVPGIFYSPSSSIAPQHHVKYLLTFPTRFNQLICRALYT